MLDLTRQYEKIRNQILPEVKRIMESQQFINGPVVKRFEDNFAFFTSAEYAVGCSSGTDALLMSLIALGIGPGDEVITTPFTFFSTVEVILRRGATPVFVDVDENTYNINISKLQEAITSRTKAIIPVHLFGQCCDLSFLKKISKEYNLHIIEDSAQAVGAKWGKMKAGSVGKVGCFSFFPSKNLGAFGDAGIVTTSDKDLYEKMLRTRQHGIEMSNPYHYEHVGGNFRLDAIQAGILDIKLRYIKKWQKMRRKNALHYDQNLKKVQTPFCSKKAYHVYNQYVVRSKNRDKLKHTLFENGVDSSIFYPYPIHAQKCISNLGYKLGDFPVCERLCNEVLAIPVYPELKQAEQEYIIDIINKT